jgi:hypothetical protein
MSAWTRNTVTGVYTHKAEPRLSVATYCDCNRSRCGCRWAAYWDGDLGPESIPSTMSPTLSEAKECALQQLAAGVLL